MLLVRQIGMMTLYPLALLVVASLDSSAQTLPVKETWGTQFSTPGATLVLKETGRNRADGHTIVSYAVFASGLPLTARYVLWMRQVGSAPQSVADALLDGEGRVVSRLGNAESSVEEDPINLKISAGRGEPKEFGLITTDSKLRAFAQVVPFPIESSQSSCRLSAIMTGPNYVGLLISATGFPPEADLIIDAESAGERSKKEAKATDQGTYQLALFPSVKGKLSGRLLFKVNAKSCAVGIDVPWGEGSYELQ